MLFFANIFTISYIFFLLQQDVLSEFSVFSGKIWLQPTAAL